MKRNRHSASSLVVSIIATVFIFIWTIFSISIGFIPFVFFGIVMLVVSIVNLIKVSKNLHKGLSNEVDFIDDDYQINHKDYIYEEKNDKNFCPYCGCKLQDDYEYLSDKIKIPVYGRYAISDFIFGRRDHLPFSLPSAHAAGIYLLFCRRRAEQ